MILHTNTHVLCFPGCSVVKNLPANTGDAGLIPELERVPGVGNGNPVQHCCLENSMDKGASQAAVLVVIKTKLGY